MLLQLIEQEQLDISQISLAAVTDQYISQLQNMEQLPIDELADFLVVAAKLLVIKSRLMVPGQPVEDETGNDLARQLRLYQAFVEAAKIVNRWWGRHRVSYPRDGYATMEVIFNPPPKLTSVMVRQMFGEVLRGLEPIVRLPQTVVVRTINIRQKIEQVKELIVRQSRTSWRQLLELATTKTEAIVTFLAVLELVKQQAVQVAQEDLFDDLEIDALPAAGHGANQP